MKGRRAISAYTEFVDTTVARRRIKELIQIAASFSRQKIEDIFVSEYREAEGRQIIESVAVFTPTYVISFNDPLKEDDFFVGPPAVVNLKISRKDFDFENWSETSRLTATLESPNGATGPLYATRGNCLELWRIVKERVLPYVGAASYGVTVGTFPT